MRMERYPIRKPNRLEGFDYASNGVYFITICVKDRKCILSRISVGADIIRPNQAILSEIGLTVDEAVRAIPDHYDGVCVDKYVIMPNHIHLLLRIVGSGGRIISAPTGAAFEKQNVSVSTIVGSLKRYVSRELGISIWQKSYYDHVIRDDYDYQLRWQYIENNPAKWALDEYNPEK